MSTRIRVSALAIAAILTAGFAAPSVAADPTNFDKFQTSCLSADALLLGDVGTGFDTAAVMTPLCSCLVTQFSGFTQPEVDMLTTDLDETSSEASHAAYADYAALSSRAGNGLEACFASDAVTAVMSAQPGAATQ
jgi:hypothetical protein